MSTLLVVEEILRESATPMSVREIVERAGTRLPSKSKTPDTVVARDLSMSIKKYGERSQFMRTSPGRYTLRSMATQLQGAAEATPMSSFGQRRPPAAASPSTTASADPRPSEIAGYLG